MTSEERLREYIEKDTMYQEYKKSNKEPSDFERFCYVHCRDIENVLNTLDEIRAYINNIPFKDLEPIEVKVISKILDKVKEWLDLY